MLNETWHKAEPTDINSVGFFTSTTLFIQRNARIELLASGVSLFTSKSVITLKKLNRLAVHAEN